MSDVQPGQPMKPQETVIYLLGELKGQMASVQSSVAASTVAQAAINNENKREHEQFRKAIEENTLGLSELRATQPIKVSVWSKAGVIIALPASVVALVGFIVVYLQPK